VACLRKDCRPSWGFFPFHSSHQLEVRVPLAHFFTSGPGVRHRLLTDPLRVPLASSATEVTA
jgi:hypothetical protein